MLITLYRTNEKGIAYYYSIHDRQGHLFSPHSFTVHWGHALDVGREQSYICDTRQEMDLRIRKIIKDKLKAGYKVLYSYFRKNEGQDLKPLIKKYYVS